MKCAACGYDEKAAAFNAKQAVDVFEGRFLEEIQSYVKPFIDVSLVKYYPGKPEPNCLIEWTDLIKAFARPVCGTVKMEV